MGIDEHQAVAVSMAPPRVEVPASIRWCAIRRSKLDLPRRVLATASKCRLKSPSGTQTPTLCPWCVDAPIRQLPLPSFVTVRGSGSRRRAVVRSTKATSSLDCTRCHKPASSRTLSTHGRLNGFRMRMSRPWPDTGRGTNAVAGCQAEWLVRGQHAIDTRFERKRIGK